MHENEVPVNKTIEESEPVSKKKKVVVADFAPSAAAKAKTLKPEQVEFYNEHGYVHPLSVFDEGEVKANSNYIEHLLTLLKEEQDGRDNYALLGYHGRCAGLYDIATNKRILDFVEDIIGPNIICWTSHLFCKAGHDPKSVPFHQDASYWRIAPTRTVSAWLAIDDSTVNNSCMHVIPGTHKLGFLPWSEAQEDAVLNQSLDQLNTLDDPVPLELKAGQISLHADLTAHGSQPNSSGARRCGFVMRFCPPSVVPLAKSWGQNALLCRGEDSSGNWTYLDRPQGDDVSSWDKYHVRQARGEA